MFWEYLIAAVVVSYHGFNDYEDDADDHDDH